MFLPIILPRGKLWEIKRVQSLQLKASRLQKAQRIANNFKLKSNFDAQGSYTGIDIYDKYEEPVQDADDL